MSFLREPGDLARTPLAALLLEAWTLRATGALSVRHAGGDSRVYFREGLPVAVQTYAGFQPLGQFLLRRGNIDVEALGRSLAEMARSRRPQGELLVEMGAVSQEVVDRALEEQQAGYLALVAGLADGAYHFDFEAPVPAWASRVLVAPARAIVDALSRPQGQPLCASALRLAAGPVVLGPGYGEMADAFSWSEAEVELVRGLASPRAVEEVIAASSLPPERARGAVAALLLLGLAGPPAEMTGRSGSSGAVRSEGAPGGQPRASGPASAGASGPGAGVASGPGSGTAPASGPSTASGPVPRRSDPEEARARRQRLLARAMQNMGTGPFAGPRVEGGVAVPPSAPAAGAAAPSAATPRTPPAAPPLDPAFQRDLDEALQQVRTPDLFARLGLPRGAGPDEVKRAYHSLVKRFHPDRLGPVAAEVRDALRELLTAVNESYRVLSDPGLRAAASGAPGPAGAPAPAGVAGAPAPRGGRPDALVAAANQALATGRPGDRASARQLLEEAMKDPGCLPAFLLAGTVAEQDGDADRAEQLFRAARRVDPGNAAAADGLRRIEAARRRKADERAAARK